MNNKQYEEQEEEEFFESFDRIQSSSASGSETEEEEEEEDVRHRITATLSQNYAKQPCQFPMATISMYDVWISEPGSIKERRKRLLQELGLSNDRALSRLTSISDTRRDIVVSSSSAADNPDECSTSGTSIVGLSCDADGKGDFGRSFSCNEFLPRRQQHVEDGGAMVRSRSDGTSVATSCCHDDGHHLCNFSFPPPPQSSISTQQCFLHNKLSPSTSKQELNTSLSTTTTTATTLASNIIIHNKPPTGKTHCPPQHISHHRQASSGKSSQGFDEIDYLKNGALNPSSILDDNVSFFREKLRNCDASNNEFHDHESGVCTIKNLDNGKEFVVNEIREDGMWNKLREVETGRQLTMEEFEMCVGHSPIVQELMRRENVEDLGNQKKDKADLNGNLGLKAKKKGNWFKSIKFVANTMAGHRERRSSDERETSSEKGGRRSSSATDDSQDVLPFQTPERIKVRQYGKSCKELTALYMSQEIQAHKGSIWSIKFSLDGRYLASAGEDRVIHVWQVLMESEKDGNVMNPPFLSPSPSPESTLVSSSSNMDNNLEKKKRGKISCSNKRYANPDHVRLPEHMFSLSEKPICSFLGHLADVFDLSWSKSQLLLSSSMDKTVRLWHMSSNSCLKMFSHSDYVTCIQFNPVDDRYFISGSLDAKVRIWSILDRQVVDWSDLHEMVTAACYTPDGQGALVGSHKGSCRLYNASGNKLNQESQINLQSKKKKSNVKKITGFQFAPGNSSEVLITSADSRIRVFDGVDLVHKFKGFRNTSSQITASLTANGKYVISASEDSYVYVWRYDGDSHIGRRSKGVTTITRSYEHFHCRDVSAAIPWPGLSIEKGSADGYCDPTNQICRAKTSIATASPLVQEPDIHQGIAASCDYATSPLHSFSGTDNNFFSDRVSATWPEEKLLATINKRSPRSNELCSNGNVQERPAWGLVIVTAGLGGKIKTFQNFGLPVRI